MALRLNELSSASVLAVHPSIPARSRTALAASTIWRCFWSWLGDSSTVLIGSRVAKLGHLAQYLGQVAQSWLRTTRSTHARRQVRTLRAHVRPGTEPRDRPDVRAAG